MQSLLDQLKEYTQQSKHPLPPHSRLMKQAVEEGLIRRIAELRLPMMLKGSYVSRQYLSDTLRPHRLPADLDWFGLQNLDQEKVNKWMVAATNHELYSGSDGLYFRDFRKNSFWRMIDYAMAEDFPTINTDLLVYLSSERIEQNTYEIRSMDVSFNLKLASPPVPLHYQPLLGEPFTIPYSCPFDIQIAWKLHQCIVSPRFKDLIDILWLLQSHPVINWKIVFTSIQTECEHGSKIDAKPERLALLLNRQLTKHPKWGDLLPPWVSWRTGEAKNTWRTMIGSFTKNSPIPLDFNDLLDELHETLIRTGFEELLALLQKKP